MARNRIDKRNVRKLYRTGAGKSVSVTLPIELIRELGWQKKQKVIVTKEGQALVIRDWER